MKILVQTGQGANYHIRQALVNGFRLSGHEVYFWDDSGKSVHDAFVEFNPNIVLSSVWQLNRAMVKCLVANPDVKVVLYSDIWGDIEKELDFNKYPVGVTSDDQKRLVEQLIRGRQDNLILITNHGNSWVDCTHGGWKSLVPHVHSVLVSADISLFYPLPKYENYKVQLAYCGGYWPFKAVNIDKYLLPLLYPNTKGWRIRLFGGGWNVTQALGSISDDEMAKHYTNAQIIPHLVEPHCSDVYQDLPLRYFQAAACQGFAVSCPVVGIREVFDENELVVADNPKDFAEKIIHYLNNPEETNSFRWNAYKKVMSEHTCLHRCKQLFNLLGEDTLSIQQGIDRIHEEIIAEYGG